MPSTSYIRALVNCLETLELFDLHRLRADLDDVLRSLGGHVAYLIDELGDARVVQRQESLREALAVMRMAQGRLEEVEHDARPTVGTPGLRQGRREDLVPERALRRTGRLVLLRELRRVHADRLGLHEGHLTHDLDAARARDAAPRGLVLGGQTEERAHDLR